MQIKRELADNVFPSVGKKVRLNHSRHHRNIPGLSRGRGWCWLLRYFHAQVPVQRGSRALKVLGLAIKYWFSPGVLKLSLLLISSKGNLRPRQRNFPISWHAAGQTKPNAYGYGLPALPVANRPPATSRFHRTAPCKGRSPRGLRGFRLFQRC